MGPRFCPCTLETVMWQKRDVQGPRQQAKVCGDQRRGTSIAPRHWTSNADRGLLGLQPKGADASSHPCSRAQIQPEPKEPDPQQTSMVGLMVTFLGPCTGTESGS